MKPGGSGAGALRLFCCWLRAMLLGRLGGSSPAHERGLYLSCSPLAIRGAGLIQIFCLLSPAL